MGWNSSSRAWLTRTADTTIVGTSIRRCLQVAQHVPARAIRQIDVEQYQIRYFSIQCG